MWIIKKYGDIINSRCNFVSYVKAYRLTYFWAFVAFYIYMCVYVYMYIYMYIYIYTYHEQKRTCRYICLSLRQRFELPTKDDVEDAAGQTQQSLSIFMQASWWSAAILHLDRKAIRRK